MDGCQKTVDSVWNINLFPPGSSSLLAVGHHIQIQVLRLTMTAMTVADGLLPIWGFYCFALVRIVRLVNKELRQEV